MMNDPAFDRWLYTAEGGARHRDACDQAIATEKMEGAAQMLHDFKSTRKSR